jgi:hypothetical protein
VTGRQIAAIGLWVLAWFSAGFIAAAFFAARDGHADIARRELAGGLIGAAGLTYAGVLLW